MSFIDQVVLDESTGEQPGNPPSHSRRTDPLSRSSARSHPSSMKGAISSLRALSRSGSGDSRTGPHDHHGRPYRVFNLPTINLVPPITQYQRAATCMQCCKSRAAMQHRDAGMIDRGGGRMPAGSHDSLRRGITIQLNTDLPGLEQNDGFNPLHCLQSCYHSI